jgi:RNA-binding protein NOB1
MADPSAPQKLVHTLVLDTGAIIKNEPSVSTLISKADSLVTVPAIIAEIKDAVTKSRVETLLMPFLTIRTPSPTAMAFVTDFARRTGDLPVLSKPDLQIVALTYELELERSGGDAKLRRVPGQKGLNFQVDAKAREAAESAGKKQQEGQVGGAAAEVKDESKPEVSPPLQEQQVASAEVSNAEKVADEADDVWETVKKPAYVNKLPPTEDVYQQGQKAQKDVTEALAQTSIDDDTTLPQTTQAEPSSTAEPTQDAEAANQDDDASDSDSDSGWITPSNLKQKQAEDAAPEAADAAPQKKMEVAVLTTDFAMQNVILQINLNLLSSSLLRIKNVRSVVLRCQACFLVCREMGKQFCPRCGKPSLTRVSCSTTNSGEFKLHLKKNFQYNSRGDRFSIPKAVHGSSNGRIKGGGKGGWGHELILAEDQKEYERAITTEKRTKERNLMDEDYLPGILTGERNKSGGRIKVGAGRNVNSKKRN